MSQNSHQRFKRKKTVLSKINRASYNQKKHYHGGVYSGASLPYIPYGIEKGAYDLKPQKLIDLFESSGTIYSTVSTFSDIIRGGGFKDESLANMIIDRKGTTLNKLLNETCLELMLFGGFSWLTNFNRLGEVGEIKKVSMSKIRLGLPNYLDEINNIFILSRYDEMMYGIRENGSHTPVRHDAFMYDANDTKNRINEVGFEKYNGQIFTHFMNTPGSEYYPSPFYLSVQKDGETERDIKESKQADVQDRFKPVAFVTEYGIEDMTEEERDIIESEYEEYQLPDGPRIWLRFAKNKESKPDIDFPQMPDLSKNYQYAEESAQDNIRRVAKLPDILYGISQAGKLSQSQEIELNVDYANALAKKYRDHIVEGFKVVMKNFKGGFDVNKQDFEIIPFRLLTEREKEENAEKEEGIQVTNKTEKQNKYNPLMLLN